MRWKLYAKLWVFNTLVLSTTLTTNLGTTQAADSLQKIRRVHRLQIASPFLRSDHIASAMADGTHPEQLLALSDPTHHTNRLWRVTRLARLRGGASPLEMAAACHGWLQYTFSPNPQERTLPLLYP